jgi:hypothetical protein
MCGSVEVDIMCFLLADVKNLTSIIEVYQKPKIQIK